jgi:hypothetical protein
MCEVMASVYRFMERDPDKGVPTNLKETENSSIGERNIREVC